VPAKPVYVKDDFFDSLIDNGGQNGRIKFSEQRKIDTEVLNNHAYFFNLTTFPKHSMVIL
jgi:hypothetical protein